MDHLEIWREKKVEQEFSFQFLCDLGSACHFHFIAGDGEEEVVASGASEEGTHVQKVGTGARGC